MPSPYNWKQYGYAKPPFRLPTDRAAEIVLNAARVAASCESPDVEPEHLLFALTAISDSMAARILEQLGVSLESVRAGLQQNGVVARAGTGNGERLLSAAARRAVDYAYEEACLLGNLFIGAEHLLLGLLRESEGPASDTLTRAGVRLEDVRDAIHRAKWG